MPVCEHNWTHCSNLTSKRDVDVVGLVLSFEYWECEKCEDRQWVDPTIKDEE